MAGSLLVRSLLALTVLAPLLGCSGDGYPTGPRPPAAQVTIQMTGEPQVTYHAATGKTNVVVQFIARDRDGFALTPAEVVVEFLLDDAPVDNESILREDAEELSASIHLGLVLDASYSMLLHEPPAFMPMLQAARDAILHGRELYTGRAGSFTWNVAWFNELIYYPNPSVREWVPGDLVTIPAPNPGSATKLFAAVTHEALRMAEAHETIANGPNDHHIMVVFSDGADNYSWFDNEQPLSQGVTANGAPFWIAGFEAATLTGAVAAIEAHPSLTTFVIGLGSDVRDDQLQPLADAGGGRYFKNLSTSEVGSLFEQVTREFATIQTHGATIPLPPGEYTFRLRVLTADRRASDEYAFDFTAGDIAAGLRR